MILIYSATLRIKCQGKFITLFEYLIDECCAAVPAFVTTRGRAIKPRKHKRNRRQQDHESATFIHKNGNVPLLQRTIKTPNNKTIQRELQP